MNTKIITVLALCLNFSTIAQDLKFNTTLPLYPDAALTKSYTAIGSPAVDLKIKITGDTLKFSGSTFPKAISTGLQSQMNFSNNSQCVTFTFTFSYSVLNLNFKLYDIDRGAVNTGSPTTYSYVDQVTISGSNFGATVLPTIVNDLTGKNTSSVSTVGNTVNGNVITGIASTNLSSNLITFSRVNSFTITYCNGPDVQTDPSSQSITIGDLNWDGPLPINLIDFYATQIDDKIKLNWSTDGEINNDYFEVQRSSNAIEFDKMVTIPGQNTITSVYSVPY